MGKTKVFRVIARLNVGGPAIHVILLTSGLDPQRYESRLISGVEAPEEGNMLGLAQEKGVAPQIIPNLGRELSLLHDWRTFWQLYTVFQRERPDIVHTHTAKAGTVGRLAAWLAGVPVIVHTFHGHVLHGYFGPVKSFVFRQIERWVARVTTQIVAVSETCRNDLIHYRIAPSEKIRTIHLGLELERFRHTHDQARCRLRREWGVPAEAFLVGMVARMVPIKRHEDFFCAIPKVLQQYPNTYFAVIGDGERRETLERLADELGIRQRCLFTGFREDQEQVFAALDVLALTSANEGLPVVVIEALASGTPVVATRVGGVPELIDDGETGYLVEPGDVDSIAEGLIKAVSNPKRTRAMGPVAQEQTIANFSIQRLIHDVENLYGELLNGVCK